MARPTLDEVRGVQDFTSLFRWNLIFASFPSAIASPPTLEDINLRCESTELPRLTDQPIIQNIRGQQVKQGGIHNYSDSITMTFVETVDNVIANFLREWKEAKWATNTGISQPKNAYQCIIQIQRLDNQDNPIYEYKLIGAFLQDFDFGGTLDGVTSDSLKPQFILAYDRFEEKPL